MKIEVSVRSGTVLNGKEVGISHGVMYTQEGIRFFKEESYVFLFFARINEGGKWS